MAGTKRSAPFVVAYGEEELYLDRIVAGARARKDRSVTYLDGDGLADHEVVSVCEQGSFDGRGRLVILDNANDVKGDKALLSYIENKSGDDDEVVLVAVIRTEKLPKLWQQAGAKGRVENCKALKSWETDLLKARIMAEAERLKVKVQDEAVEAFVFYFGDNLRRIANELQKLSFVVAEGGSITKKDVIQMTAPDMPMPEKELMFEIAKVATNKEMKRALRLVSLLFKASGDAVAVPITAGLLNQMERLLLTRQMLDNGTDIKTIAEALGVPPYPVQKDIVPRARKHTVAELLRQMQNLCRLDAQVKGAARSKRTLVELAILSIAA